MCCGIQPRHDKDIACVENRVVVAVMIHKLALYKHIAIHYEYIKRKSMLYQRYKTYPAFEGGPEMWDRTYTVIYKEEGNIPYPAFPGVLNGLVCISSVGKEGHFVEVAKRLPHMSTREPVKFAKCYSVSRSKTRSCCRLV